MSSPLTYIAEVPSNIALVKYWGKKNAAKQIPANDSLSMTLQNSLTKTSAKVDVTLSEHQVLFESKPVEKQSAFGQKIFRQLNFLAQTLKADSFLAIDTANTFPNSCGIASSASGMGALTLAAAAAWTESKSFAELTEHGFSLEKLADLARQGSASAARSFFPGFVKWQVNKEQSALSYHYKNPGWELADIIVLISREKKSVSSSDAHAYAWSSPLFLPRLALIPERMQALDEAIDRKDFAALGQIAEADCLDMHSVMLSSTPAINFLQQKTIEFISWVREERFKEKLNAFFTIDAGANVHLLCEKSQVAAVTNAVSQKFPHFELLVDHIGQGPKLKALTKEMI